MTIYDLVFLVSFLIVAGTVLRLAYLAARKRWPTARRLSQRLAAFIAVYFAALLACSAFQPAKTVALHEPQCFDDFCIAVDSAVRQPSIGTTAARGDFIVVSGRLVSRAARRRQRETDVAGVLRVDANDYVGISESGEAALRSMGLAGDSLTSFVEPLGSNAFKLAYDVPKSSRRFEFVVQHGAFPADIIIGDSQSFFHRRTAVELPFTR